MRAGLCRGLATQAKDTHRARYSGQLLVWLAISFQRHRTPQGLPTTSAEIFSTGKGTSKIIT